ncbi:MAG: PQQ-binding-like beta-propeller repeat protein, partial [Planctomycetaceae bacterium]|nr:PQQ-binding-like beta-propeller repeat protein [Planctomycetaceae bacterium]
AAGNVSSPVRDGRLTLQTPAWLSTRLEQIWQGLPEGDRPALDARIRGELEEARRAGTDRMAALELVFRFHPDGRKLAVALADEALQADQPGTAEAQLRSLRADEWGEHADSLMRLADAWARAGSANDGRRVAEALKASGDAATPSGEHIGTWADNWLAAHPPQPEPDPALAWRIGDCELARTGFEFGPGFLSEIILQGRPAEWFQGRSLMVEAVWDGLACISRSTGEREWVTPLGSSSGHRYEPSPLVVASGGIALMAQRGSLVAMSPVDRRVLWTWPFPARFVRQPEYYWYFSEESGAVRAARTGLALTGEFASASQERRIGPLVAVSGRTVVVLGQRELAVFDLLTGQERWRRQGMASSSLLVVDGDAVCVSKVNETGAPAAFHLLDGRPLPGESLASVFDAAFEVDQDQVLTVQRRYSPIRPTIALAAMRPHSGEAAWELTFPRESEFSRTGRNELTALTPDGKVAVVDTRTGERTDLGTVPVAALRTRQERWLFADSGRVYVLMNGWGHDDYSYISLKGVRAHGELYAFDRATRTLAWKKTIRGQNIILNQFDDNPVILLAGYRTEQKIAGTNTLYVSRFDLQALDKLSGRELLNWSGPAMAGSPSSIRLDIPGRRIDLMSYNERFRLQFQSPHESPGEEPPPADPAP